MSPSWRSDGTLIASLSVTLNRQMSWFGFRSRPTAVQRLTGPQSDRERRRPPPKVPEPLWNRVVADLFLGWRTVASDLNSVLGLEDRCPNQQCDEAQSTWLLLGS